MKLKRNILNEHSPELEELLSGMRKQPKTVSSKWFYDSRGAELFDQICTLPEYYPTRTETSILRENASSISDLVSRRSTIYEFGSGSSTKVGILFDAISDLRGYVPIDICQSYLKHSVESLGRERPGLRVSPLHADFTNPFTLTDSLTPETSARERLGFFPGSTIGNFTPVEAAVFLRNLGRTLGTGGSLLIGVDLVKDRNILEAAYNDNQGVTSQFNLNLLNHLNQAFGSNFDLENFEHRAFFNSELSRIEMHLVAKKSCVVQFPGESVHFEAGESLHTENSYKYTLGAFRSLLESSGFSEVDYWTDQNGYFGVFLFRIFPEVTRSIIHSVTTTIPRSLTVKETVK